MYRQKDTCTTQCTCDSSCLYRLSREEGKTRKTSVRRQGREFEEEDGRRGGRPQPLPEKTTVPAPLLRCTCSFSYTDVNACIQRRGSVRWESDGNLFSRLARIEEVEACFSSSLRLERRRRRRTGMQQDLRKGRAEVPSSCQTEEPGRRRRRKSSS